MDSFISFLGTHSTFEDLLYFLLLLLLSFYLRKISSQISGLPVTIRLLDPPLHEFLPEGDVQEIVSELTAETGMNEDEVFSRIEKLAEVNPMLGFRGCRFSGLLMSF
jgi:phosphoenolpyruvate synthase/pyruvate phosphate dikinase